MEKLKEFAEKLNGRQYRNELTKELETYAKENGIVIVFGASDDLMEFEGDIYDEFGCYGGGNFAIDDNGNVYGEEYGVMPADRYYHYISAIWCPKGTKYSWGYETDIPHETFTIMEDNEPYCKGIVFYLKDLKPKKTNFDRITSSVESLAEFLAQYIEHYKAPREVKQIQVDSIDNRTGQGLPWAEAFKEWLQKECEG